MAVSAGEKLVVVGEGELVVELDEPGLSGESCEFSPSVLSSRISMRRASATD